MAVSSLCNALLSDPDATVRGSAAEALGKIGDEDAIPALTEALSDENREVRQRVAKALGKIGGNNPVSGDRIINTGGGNYYESINTSGGNYIQGDYISMNQNLSQAATEIQDLVEQLQGRGVTVDDAQEQVARGMATQAQNDPTMRGKLVKWGQSLGDATVSDVVKGVVKLAIRSAGIPLP
ncbi:MAG: HEAT repeat domain-containing protein [Leptolyngbyaceae cyanobacterium RM2_2_4]|nr:HEAT repeat domain-containing protein [Leptolyngbyaceae cyanobacterium SM1_4_3]NJO52990.1 HEAT repeat domain-containing protein [Leptolyngbyaceae cyanobacterium RM2_2_4]NJO66419.1 HEAT repeat domain-containing protein [Leptolyngbyaceae cyanobacterium RM1_405_57]